MFTRRLFSKTAALAAMGLFVGISTAPMTAFAQTPIKFTLDWKFEGPAAGFLLALDKDISRPKGWM